MIYLLIFIKNYFKKIKLKKQNIIIEKNVSFNNTVFSIYNRILKNTNINDSHIGKCTYIGWNCTLSNVYIGSFSSIGPFVEVIYGTHPIGYVSTHPIFYSNRKQCGISFVEQNKFNEFKFISIAKKSAIIGSDVWIGHGVKIIEGVTIGDGAVVLAGAIVTKDVEPFSIVGGVPAKHIKYRFDSESIKLLFDLQWWNKDIEWIKNNADYFIDVECFLSMINRKINV